MVQTYHLYRHSETGEYIQAMSTFQVSDSSTGGTIRSPAGNQIGASYNQTTSATNGDQMGILAIPADTCPGGDRPRLSICIWTDRNLLTAAGSPYGPDARIPNNTNELFAYTKEGSGWDICSQQRTISTSYGDNEPTVAESCGNRYLEITEDTTSRKDILFALQLLAAPLISRKQPPHSMVEDATTVNPPPAPVLQAFPDVSAHPDWFIMVYKGRFRYIGGNSASSPTFVSIISMGCRKKGFNVSIGWDPSGSYEEFRHLDRSSRLGSITGPGTPNFEKFKGFALQLPMIERHAERQLRRQPFSSK
ncbi:hypothetical protein EDC04DRAFT_2600618 [Pisolithus marmoratus]|nr:hypothetical protein EDC04DRAFT_2600618 [Pisolithus marmoratus]